MTPIAEKIKHDLDQRYHVLNRDKLTRWLMSRASGKELNIIDCRGAPIGTGLGFVFEGQLRELFWSFIRPCLEDAIQASTDAVEGALPAYSPADRTAALQNVEAIVNGFVERIYRRMVGLDRRMRGKGYPESVRPYEPSREIQYARELMAHKVTILRNHYVRATASVGAPLEHEEGSIVEWDVFISHASEDKEEFARPLAEGLHRQGLKVWFDAFTLTVGDSLRRSIDRGLAQSRFGVVIISPDFMRKEWPQKELDGLVAREVDGVKVILPVWHRITGDEIRKHSPLLADRLAASSQRGVGHVVDELLRAMGHAATKPATVALIEAATQAYEQTRGTLVAAAAEASSVGGKRHNRILTWFCWALGDRLSIYGNWPPSRVPEKIDWATARNRHSFRMRDGSLVFQEHNGDGHYENLYVLKSELQDALASIRAIAPDRLGNPEIAPRGRGSPRATTYSNATTATMMAP